MRNQNIQVGDIVHERLQFDTKSQDEFEGVVIYVHPERRFYRAEFELLGGTVREAFSLYGNDRVTKFK